MLDETQNLSLSERLRGESGSLFSDDPERVIPPENSDEVVFTNADDEIFRSANKPRKSEDAGSGKNYRGDSGDDYGGSDESDTDSWGPDGKPGTADDEAPDNLTRADQEYLERMEKEGRNALGEYVNDPKDSKTERNPEPPAADDEPETDPDY